VSGLPSPTAHTARFAGELQAECADVYNCPAATS
jgi:hypothetical protein